MPTASLRRREIALFAILVALVVYVCVLAAQYYFRLRGVQRHHLETAWMWLIFTAILAAFTTNRSSTEEEQAPTVFRMPIYLPIACIATAFALYFPALRLGFLSDDFTLSDLALRNQLFGQSWAFLRPLPLLCYRIVGAHPWALHALVVTLHGVNAALVIRLAAIFGLSARQAVAAGLLFVAFPASLEAVAWCAGLQDVLMTTGVLVAVVAATLSNSALSLAAVAAALLSKETAVAAPVLMWL
jgi:hypothetical protein